MEFLNLKLNLGFSLMVPSVSVAVEDVGAYVGLYYTYTYILIALDRRERVRPTPWPSLL